MKRYSFFISLFLSLSLFLPAAVSAADLTVTSESFTAGGSIPAKCSRDGGNKSPQLS